jgi:hypothetical protein
MLNGSPSVSRITAVLVGILAVGIIGSLPWAGQTLSKVSPLLAKPATHRIAQGCMALVALFVLAACLFFWWRRPIEACAAFAVMMIPGSYMLVHFQQQTAPVTSRAYLARIVAREAPETWPVVIANPRDPLFEGVGGWGFYAHRKVLMVAFEYPVRGPFQGVTRPDWIIDMQDLEDLWISGHPLVLTATPEGLERLPFTPSTSPRARDEKFGLWIFESNPSRPLG